MPYILKTNLPTDRVVAVGDDITFEEKLLYGGENIALGDEVFIWFTENRGKTDRPKGPGLAGVGVCFNRNLDGGRIRITLVPSNLTPDRPMTVSDLERFSGNQGGEPISGIARKLLRHAHNKVAFLKDEEADFLRGYFRPQLTIST